MGNSQNSNGTERIDKSFIDSYIAALLQLKEIPLISNISTYGEMLAYVTDRDFFLENSDKMDILEVETYKTNEFGQKIIHSFAWEPETSYSYMGKKYVAKFWKLKFFKLYDLFGRYNDHAKEIAMTNMLFILCPFKENFEVCVSKNFILGSPDRMQMIMLRTKIKETITKLEVAFNKKIEWKDKQNRDLFNNSELKIRIHDLKVQKLELEVELDSFILVSKREYSEIIDRIRNNMIEQREILKKIEMKDKIIKEIDGVTNFCQIIRKQQSILSHFLFVTDNSI